MWAIAKDFLRYGSQLKHKKEGAGKKGKNSKQMFNKEDDLATRMMTATSERVPTSPVISCPERPKSVPPASPKRAQKASKVPTSFATADAIKAGALQEYKGPSCPVCGQTAIIKTANEYRGQDKPYCYWVCPSCPNMSVTTAGKTYLPSGILADAETRRFRSEVQALLAPKKTSVGNDRFALNEWIHVTLSVSHERAWVGQLTKAELAQLARATQNEIFEQKYGYIFRDNQSDKNHTA